MQNTSELPVLDDLVRSAKGPWWEWIPDIGRQHRFSRLGGMVLVHRYEDCWEVLRDPARFREGVFAAIKRLEGVDPRFVERRSKSLLSLEGEDHQRLRRLALPVFRAPLMDPLRPRMRRIFSDMVDAAASGAPLDAVSALTRQYPLSVICAVLGVPTDDLEFFSEIAEAQVSGLSGSPDTFPAAMRAYDELDRYLTELLQQRRERPTDDLLSNLVRAEENGDRFSREELISLVSTLLVAGTDTTRTTLASVIYLFAKYPEQWDDLVANPELVPSALDEVMRFAPTAFVIKRMALADVTLGGLDIPAGTEVATLVVMANRDPDVFADPDRFDIRRVTRRPNLGFGAGYRHCIGNALAKAELEEALKVLVERFERIEPAGAPSWRRPDNIQGPTALPVRLIPRAADRQPETVS
ncbi:cytochrome P450 [Amycolatopsis sp. AA4]|uniref:cytochrome P450 n=1 Tax=Actinomycetes TaxID=1760 RepID=UPI0001B57072|nr:MULTISPECIES: cytochrome P450 [Actinomycetes]ATY12782.1 cytochrome P450 [Amycolatopsis sp. AA4]